MKHAAREKEERGGKKGMEVKRVRSRLGGVSGFSGAQNGALTEWLPCGEASLR
jgi:hypothetical protein